MNVLDEVIVEGTVHVFGITCKLYMQNIVFPSLLNGSLMLNIETVLYETVDNLLTKHVWQLKIIPLSQNSWRCPFNFGPGQSKNRGGAE